VGHACLEAGARFPQSPEASHLVLLAVPFVLALCDALARLDTEGIRYAVFYEPDDDLGFTAACTEPLEEPHRRLFRRYPLWR
jgi:hypothetical protein